MEDVERLFNEEVQQKKITARGARNRASRTGRIGKVKLPADFLGKEYRQNSKPISFSVDDVLYILQETPTLKDLLMQRLDVEYEHYRLAISRTIDAVARIQEKALQSILERVTAVEQQVDGLATENNRLVKVIRSEQTAQSGKRRKIETEGVRMASATGKNMTQPTPGARSQPAGKLPLLPSVKGKRGGRRPASQEVLKARVFKKLDTIIGVNKDVDFKTVNSLFPGIQYYIYKLRVWDSFEDLRQDFISQHSLSQY